MGATNVLSVEFEFCTFFKNAYNCPTDKATDINLAVLCQIISSRATKNLFKKYQELHKLSRFPLGVVFSPHPVYVCVCVCVCVLFCNIH